MYFNPRSREGSDSHAEFDICRAPAFQSTLPRRERLIFFAGCDILSLISIHAPAKGATLLRSGSYLLQINFNPRSREGSDTDSGWKQNDFADFNPRSREGSDGLSGRLQTSSNDFNPRSREGSDHQSSLTTFSCVYFNPRSREGSDLLLRERRRHAFISIHAPAKGATRKCPKVFRRHIISIHAPAKGATPPPPCRAAP